MSALERVKELGSSIAGKVSLHMRVRASQTGQARTTQELPRADNLALYV